MFIANLPIYKKLTQQRSITFAQYLAPLIPNGSHLLDFGCGNMYTARQLLNHLPNLKITGFDIIRDQNLSDEILSDKRLAFQLSGEKGIDALENSFDGAIALATLHHTPDPEYFLSELKRVVKPGGFIILVEEMAINLLDKVYISVEDWLLNKMKEGVPVPLNFRYHKQYLEEFRKQGLKIEFHGSVRPFPTMMHHYVYKLVKE
ncbi:MAG TPA: class I SAM-dependent methyltransferase [Flavipsychrobacter sp.]|nr:class I SAM-dependent methyltransferase [Flavipsychrobacter sp.]